MAKRSKSSVNKSLEIRSYIEANPDAKPKEVVSALAEKGVVVSAAFVSTLKSNDKRKGGAPAGKRGRKPGGGSIDGIETLVQAKKLVDQMGGIDVARRALESLAKILGS